jgi:HPt (histidine-containing phosphotransfer) domain-containing protein
MTAHAMTGDKEKCLAAGMDGYVSKPIHTPLLRAEIERLTGIAVTPPKEGQPMDKSTNHPQGPAVDMPDLLARIDNDRDLLHELLSIFKEDFPRHLQELQDALAKSDLPRVRAASHALKGMLANLAANRAAACAAALEQVAKAGDSASLPASFAAFEQEAQRLLPEMETYMVQAQP